MYYIVSCHCNSAKAETC